MDKSMTGSCTTDAAVEMHISKAAREQGPGVLNIPGVRNKTIKKKPVALLITCFEVWNPDKKYIGNSNPTLTIASEYILDIP